MRAAMPARFQPSGMTRRLVSTSPVTSECRTVFQPVPSRNAYVPGLTRPASPVNRAYSLNSGAARTMSLAASESATCEKAAPTGTCTRTGSPVPSPAHAAPSIRTSRTAGQRAIRVRACGLAGAATVRPAAASSADLVIAVVVDRCIARLLRFALQSAQVRLQDEHGGRSIDAVLAFPFLLRQAQRPHSAFCRYRRHTLVHEC